MGIRIMDCTIRDGGYLLHKNPDELFIRGILDGLAKAGIEFVETGFLQTKLTGDSLVYKNAREAAKYLPDRYESTEFVGFCDNSRYSSDQLEQYDGQSFKWLRISFAKHEVDQALNFCKCAQDKGYLVQFNPMDTISYSEKELEILVDKANLVKPGSFSIVDTFGAMHLHHLKDLFEFIDEALDGEICIGLHSHDNLGLSNALAELFCELAIKSDRDAIVDGSLLGMGRGAGNARIEVIADYLNATQGTNYNIATLIDTIEKHICPLDKAKIHWGYDVPMFICGAAHSHVDNAYFLSGRGCSLKDMYNVIYRLEPAKRTRYGVSYSKDNFDDLEKEYEQYIRR